MYDFILPDIGEGISEALLINWSVEIGQEVAEGDEIATVSTDKVDVELPAPRAGTVAELCWKPGDTVQVGSVFMRIDTGGEAEEISKPGHKKPPVKTASAAHVASASPAKSAPHAIVCAPSTRKLAAEKGVDLAEIRGSGPDGRILRTDIESHAAGVADSVTGGTPEPLNRFRAVMAERMAYSVHTLAHSTMNFEMRAEAFSDALQALKTAGEKQGAKVSATALMVACLGDALTRHPRFNATIDEKNRQLLLHDEINLGVAMATERGLMVPVLRGVNGEGILQLASRLNDLVQRTRTGALEPAEMSKGTFTLSNTGGLEEATITSTRPVINAPQSATLWISKIQQRPVVHDGALAVGKVMYASLSFDHRFIDGADTVAFINDFARLIESPPSFMSGQ